MKKLNVLISAHEFSPYQGSECSEGWNLVTRLTHYHDITLLYASGSQFDHNSYVDAVNQYLSSNNLKLELNLVNIDQPKLTKLISKLNSKFLSLGSIGFPFLYFMGYRLWQRTVLKKAKELNKKFRFDVVHQLTQITFREPGYLWKLNIPFVWGPTGGTAVLPQKFVKYLSPRSRFLERIRSFSNIYQFSLVPRIVKANKVASIIYTFSKEDALKFSKKATGKIKLMLDAGTIFSTEKPIRKRISSDTITGIWCGQIIERKGLGLLLKAISKVQLGNYKMNLLIVGSGPLENQMVKLAQDLKLENVSWVGSVCHDEIFGLLQKSDFLVHTSLREATSNIIPEALSMSLPVICHDVNGMSIAVNETCGIKVPLISPEESIEGFYNAIMSLISDPDYLMKLTIGANKRAQEISWDNMAETIATGYINIINEESN